MYSTHSSELSLFLTPSPGMLMYLSHVGTNFRNSVAPKIMHLYPPSFTNSHLHFLTTVLISPPYLLPVNLDGGKHVSPTNTEPHQELLCGTKLPISFPLHINFSQEQDLIYWLFRHLLHVTPNTSAASYRKVKCLKNTTLWAQELTTWRTQRYGPRNLLTTPRIHNDKTVCIKVDYVAYA
jgi:hypothetical protein